ncbi:MAG: hypothetical protein Q4C42_03065 [Clostridia bacterium]|nr:hypothetical protein [Clostridia bacterium]
MVIYVLSIIIFGIGIFFYDFIFLDYGYLLYVGGFEKFKKNRIESMDIDSDSNTKRLGYGLLFFFAALAIWGILAGIYSNYGMEFSLIKVLKKDSLLCIFFNGFLIIGLNNIITYIIDYILISCGGYVSYDVQIKFARDILNNPNTNLLDGLDEEQKKKKILESKRFVLEDDLKKLKEDLKNAEKNWKNL